MVTTLFTDRRQAGQELAGKLSKYKGSVVVFALPRGGVETAVEIAEELEAPLDLVIARKIGHPGSPEYAVGAITESGPVVWNEDELGNLDSIWLKQAEKKAREEAKRRRMVYLDDHKHLNLSGKTAILVDDGIATGLTMQAAVAEILSHEPDEVVVAVPVAPRDTVEELMDQVDEVIVLINPRDFMGAVGAHYENFPQLSDDDVLMLLEEV